MPSQLGEAGRHLFIIRIGVVAVIEEGKKNEEARKKKGSITQADSERSEEKDFNIVATLEEGSFFGMYDLFSIIILSQNFTKENPFVLVWFDFFCFLFFLATLIYYNII